MTKNKKGFTIIEVVLVLAIAGLIFLMVFIALPALQRSQRKTQREDDLARVLTAANDYQTNNNGKSPWDAKNVNKNFVKRYIDDTCDRKVGEDGKESYECSGDQFRDPDGENYNMTFNGRMDDKSTLKGFALEGAGTEGENTQLAEISNPEFDHTFKAITYASCGDEGQAKKGTGNRPYAVYFVLEGGAVSCNDNH